MTFTFFWHDYETWGADPRRDRASQFAGIRTDADLNPVGQPLSLYCKPADDILPQPEACLVTGITPQKALAEGVNEAEFFKVIHDELSRPGTCGVGYNSIRFDDEFTRYGLYRNFFDPYAREWRDGNSRWDIIDMVRLTHTLRPEGIVWPTHEDGSPSFRLEQLTEANGITHESAHDALSDVYATIAMARLIQKKQPRLFSYLLQMRDKGRLASQFNMAEKQPMLHVSSMYPASRGCIAMVVPVARHPTNNNGIIVYDLRSDPSDFLNMTPEQIRQRLFTPRDQLPEGVERVPLKTVHLNKCPVVVPMSTMSDEAAENWGIDLVTAERHRQLLLQAQGLDERIREAFSGHDFPPINDPDQSLYSGGFFSDGDRRQMEQMRMMSPEKLADYKPRFNDQRLPEMLFRYRARNWPQSLSRQEQEQWEKFRLARLTETDAGGSIDLKTYQQEIARKMVQPDLDEEARAVLSELADWPAQILP
ncbi:MAG: exodeoxyribonuclease I [Gammaproteobacteria bacterium]|nr:exodeoxyribonuclease I [Gammaproteobacteria bacterium]